MGVLLADRREGVDVGLDGLCHVLARLIGMGVDDRRARIQALYRFFRDFGRRLRCTVGLTFFVVEPLIATSRITGVSSFLKAKVAAHPGRCRPGDRSACRQCGAGAGDMSLKILFFSLSGSSL